MRTANKAIKKQEIYTPPPDVDLFIYPRRKNLFMEVPYRYKTNYRYIIDLINIKKKPND